MNREGLSLVGRLFGKRELSYVDISVQVQALEDKRSDGEHVTAKSQPPAAHVHPFSSPAVASMFSSLFPSRSERAKEKRGRGMARSPEKWLWQCG